ncbi:hypothetical protein BH11PSE2_BH11PSE2_17840 [soil metagenome]
MNGIELFDPAAGPGIGWPAGCEADRAYLQAFTTHGAPALIANLRTRLMGLRCGDRILPVTINEAEYGDAYVCLPHSAYALYAKAELKIVDAGPWSPALGLLADVAGLAMRAARVNRVVHLGNWMVSTNLHGGWRGDDITEIRAILIKAFPDHLLAVRSLTRWSDADLCDSLAADGWLLLPSRQIYVTDDLAQDWAPHRDTRRDLALLAASAAQVDHLDTLRPGDAARIAQLYAMLYLERYSRLNPAFTPAYVEMTHRSGILRYRGLRGADGVLSSVVGCLVRGGVLTTPIVGYDTARPEADGLYRIASAMLAQMAMEAGARLNGSAGAADFKRHRGARPELECSAYYAEHLSAGRRLTLRAMQKVLTRFAAPLMAERGL